MAPPSVDHPLEKRLLAALFFQDEVAAEVIAALRGFAHHGQRRAAASTASQVVVEADEVIQAPGLSEGGVAAICSFAQYCIVFHGRRITLIIKWLATAKSGNDEIY
jgi:hypothetical protein